MVVHVIERRPAAIWQHNGQLTLIDAEGVVLEPVRLEAMPDLPLLIGPAANRHVAALAALLETVPRLRPQVSGATWVGLRRWDIRFQSGETLTLPEGNVAARRAIQRFAMMDQQNPLLGRGFARIACAIQARLCRISREPVRRRSGRDAAHPRRSARSVEDDMRLRTPRPIAPPPAGSHELMVRRAPQPAQSTLVAASTSVRPRSAPLDRRADDEGALKILGTGQRESRGVKRGFIADMERTEATIREAVEQAERIAATNIENVYVGFSAGGLVSTIASVESNIGGRRITGGDVDDLLEAGRRSINPEGRTILHALPAYYTIDGVDGVKQPRGLYAEKLGVDIHVIAADPAPWMNLNHCVRSAQLGVEAIVASLVAAGKACLSEEERELAGPCRIGRGVTNVSGSPAACWWAEVAGDRRRHITDDIAAASAPAASRPSASNASTARR